MMTKGWIVNHLPTFKEVIPLNDLREHWLGDECWCEPKVTKIDGSPEVLITHNSKDRRELKEKGIVITSD